MNHILAGLLLIIIAVFGTVAMKLLGDWEFEKTWKEQQDAQPGKFRAESWAVFAAGLATIAVGMASFLSLIAGFILLVSK